MKRFGTGVLTGCLGALLLAGQLCAEGISSPDALFQEASSLYNSAQKVENENFAESYRYYKLASEKIEDLLSSYPTSKEASQVVQGKLRIGGYTYDELKGKVLPQTKRKAEAEADPIEAIILLAERKADEAYLEAVLNGVIRIYKKRGQIEKAVEVALTRTRFFDRPRFLMKLAFDYSEQGKKKEALALLEKATAPPPQPLKEDWQIERFNSIKVMIASAYIRLEAPERARLLLDQVLPTAKSATILAELATGYANIGDKEKADVLFARAVALKGRWDVESLARSLAEAGRYDEARRMLQEVESLSQRVSLLLTLYGAATRRGDSAVASKLLNEVLEGAKQEKDSQQIYQQSRKWLEFSKFAREFGEIKWAIRFLERLEQSINTNIGQQDLLLSLAEEYWKVGQPQRIGPLLDRIKIPDSAGLSTQDQQLPTLYARIGKVEQALQILDKYQMGDGKVGGRLQVAEVIWERGRRSEALALLKKTESEFQETVQSKRPGYHFEVIRLASQYGAFGEESEAVRVLTEAEKQALMNGGSYGKVPALIDIARCYVKLRQPEQADRLLSMAVELTMKMNDRWNEPQLYEMIASVYAEAELFQRALEVAERMKGDDEKIANTWLNIAIKQLASKQIAQGRERMEGAIKLLKKTGAVERARVAEGRLALGEIDEVFRWLDQSKERDSKLGELAWIVDSLSKSEASFPEASIVKIKTVLRELERQSGSAEESIVFGLIWARLGEHQQADRFFAQAEERLANSGFTPLYDPLRIIISSLVNLGQPERALLVADEIKNPSEKFWALNLAGWTLIDQQKLEIARSALSKMEESAKEIPEASRRSVLLEIARRKIALGENDAGLTLLNKVVASPRAPNERVDDISIASAYIQAGQYEKGMDLLEEALKRAEDYRPDSGKVIELGRITFPLAEAGRVDPRVQRFLHAMIQQADAIPAYGPNR